MAKYKVLVGLNYGPDDTRAEPGDTVDSADLGETLAATWAEQGVLKPLSASKPKAKPKAKPPAKAREVST